MLQSSPPEMLLFGTFRQEILSRHNMIKALLGAVVVLLPAVLFFVVVSKPLKTVTIIDQIQTDVTPERAAILRTSSDQDAVIECVKQLVAGGAQDLKCTALWPLAARKMAATRAWAGSCDLWYRRAPFNLHAQGKRTLLKELDRKVRCQPQFIANIQLYDRHEETRLYHGQFPQGRFLADILQLDRTLYYRETDLLRLVSLSHKSKDGQVDQRFYLFRAYGSSGHLLWHSGPDQIAWGYTPR